MEMTINIEFEAEAIQEMSIEDIISLMDKNEIIRGLFRKIADDYDTEWTIEDIFRNCPKGVEVNDYGWKCGLWINRMGLSWGQTEDVYNWAWSVLDDSGYQFCVDGVDKCEKVERYLPVLREDCYSINVAEKDYDYMYNYVHEVIQEMLDEVSSLVNSIQEQFDDDYYMLDCLLSNGLLRNYYVVGDHLYEVDDIHYLSRQVA